MGSRTGNQKCRVDRRNGLHVISGYRRAWPVGRRCGGVAGRLQSGHARCGVRPHSTTSFLLDDAPQPDLYLRILPEFGGKSWVEDKYLHGVPELLTEISLTSESYDLHLKLDLYEAAKIPEYLVVLLYEREIRWHILVDGRYQLMAADADGLWRSRIFPGLWLDGKALLSGDLEQVLARLGQGLQSPEHQRFVADLAARKSVGE